MSRRKSALLDAEGVIRLLRREVKRAGSQAEWARKVGTDQPSVCYVLLGKKPVTKPILKALKLRKVAAYERVS